MASLPPVAPVRYCERSTISEAWALVLGKPSLPDADEVSAVVHAARKAIGGLTTVPSLVMVQGAQEGALPPHWHHQLTWSDGEKLARIGHQYLSVHFVRREGLQKYETYGASLKPDLVRWLDLQSSVLARPPESYPLDRVVFGYVNTFDFAANEFELSRFFKANIGLDIDIARGGLRGLDAKFRMFAGCVNEVTLAIEVQSIEVPAADDDGDGGSQTTVSVVTKTVAQELTHELTVFDSEAILDAVERAKDRAKAVFFDFATSETHELMGAMQ